MLLASCGAAQKQGGAAGLELYVSCDPACYVYIDGDLRGRANPDSRFALARGDYRLLLVEPGFLNARYDVRLDRRDVEVLHPMWPIVEAIGHGR